MRKFVLLVLIPLLSACSAHMDSNLSKDTAYAPVNEIEGGVVSYLKEGANWIIQKRRDNAYKKMHDRCQGPYRIVQESDSPSAGLATPVAGSVIYGESKYREIRFECVH